MRQRLGLVSRGETRDAVRAFMDFSLDKRTSSLGVGEFADFVVGPRDSKGGTQGLWRAQLGTHWHQQLRAQAASEQAGALFEVPIDGQVFHRGWTLTLTGRIDQLVPGADVLVLREIKTVTRPLPAEETELRAAYPGYFAQLATYLALRRLEAPTAKFRGELVFVEVDSGLSQTVVFSEIDENNFRAQLDRVADFLDLRVRARERLRGLRYLPAFFELRGGQESIQAELAEAARERSILFFEAPTGFGKTGVLLEFALGQLREGLLERLLYVTSKSTGQIQVSATLSRMTALPGGGAGVAAWHVRNKREHCINTVFQCSPEVCPHLIDLEQKWPRSSLSRFYLFENEPRDLASLRAAGRAATVCPYEITRASLAFNDVWIGDYNYVFSPASRGLFFEQPGFDASRTLLVVDEAHNLPSRVADVYSHRFSATGAGDAAAGLRRIHAPARLTTAWEHWTHFLDHLAATEALDLDREDDARHLLDTVAKLVATTPLDSTALGTEAMEQLWEATSFSEELASAELPRLWWSPQGGELAVTCLDAAPAISTALRSFGKVILASATLTPADTFAAYCGLDNPPPEIVAEPAATNPDRLGRLNKRQTRRLYSQLMSGAELLRVDEAKTGAAPALLRAHAPWRDHAYDVAIDVRVDTTYQQRDRHQPTTARTIGALQRAAGGPVVVFFPSYRYAEAIRDVLQRNSPDLRVALQPRLPDLAKQTAWVEESLLQAHVLFLVLGSSFAEGIDLLGGRVTHAMVVGPALPEVNPVQKARLATAAPLGREEAFRRVYQAPGIQKVNQALGRLVRAPGQHARILLHCRRFAEAGYATLLAPEYRGGIEIRADADLDAWLGLRRAPESPLEGAEGLGSDEAV